MSIRPNKSLNYLQRIEPEFSINAAGEINWTASMLDYDPNLFYRGKQVTSDQYNSLFIRQAAQGNYTADSLQKFFKEHLNTAIRRQVTNNFNLLPGYVKFFTESDWGSVHDDGYYYINIPASVHGFAVEEDSTDINIEAEMWILNDNNTFFNVTQVEIDPDNTVRIYTDDPTVAGIISIKTNDKSVAVSAVSIDASQISGLSPVAITGSYNDLVNKPDDTIANLLEEVNAIVSGIVTVPKAQDAEYAAHLLQTSTIQNIPVSSIFEEGSAFVKNATNATNAVLLSDNTYGQLTQDSDGTLRLGECIIPIKVPNKYSKNTALSAGNSVDIDLSFTIPNTQIQIQYTKSGIVHYTPNFSVTALEFGEGGSYHNDDIEFTAKGYQGCTITNLTDTDIVINKIYHLIV